MSNEASITPGPEVGDEVSPAPARFRKLKRGVVAVLALAALLGATYWWWSCEAQRRLNKLIADAHARGEPILPEDFIQHGNDDPDNAAVLLLQAHASFSFTAAEIRIDLNDDPTSNSIPDQKKDEIAAMIRNHRGEL